MVAIITITPFNLVGVNDSFKLDPIIFNFNFQRQKDSVFNIQASFKTGSASIKAPARKNMNQVISFYCLHTASINSASTSLFSLHWRRSSLIFMSTEP